MTADNNNTPEDSIKETKRVEDKRMFMLTEDMPRQGTKFQEWIELVNEIAVNQRLTDYEIIELIDKNANHELNKHFRNFRATTPFSIERFTQWFYKFFGIRKDELSPYSKMEYFSTSFPKGTWHYNCSKWREMAWKIFGDEAVTVNEYAQHVFVDTIPHSGLRNELRKLIPRETLSQLIMEAEDTADRLRIPLDELKYDPSNPYLPLIALRDVKASDKIRKRYRENQSSSSVEHNQKGFKRRHFKKALSEKKFNHNRNFKAKNDRKDFPKKE